MAIPISKPEINEIVTFCGNVPLEDAPLNKIGMAKYKVKKSHTIKGPFVSPSFLDAIGYPFFLQSLNLPLRTPASFLSLAVILKSFSSSFMSSTVCVTPLRENALL